MIHFCPFYISGSFKPRYTILSDTLDGNEQECAIQAASSPPWATSLG